MRASREVTRARTLRTVHALLLATLALAVLACATPQGTPVTYKNEMSIELTVTSDEFFLVTLLPGERKVRTTREDLLPDRIRAYNAKGELVYDRTFTWEDLKANNFLVVLK